MAHDAHIEVVPGEYLIQPLRPFQIFDRHMDADLREFGRHDLAAAPRIARRRQLQRDGEAARIARSRQQYPGFRHVVRIDAREIQVGRVARREMAADRRAISVHGAVDDGAPIERVGNRPAHR